MSRSLDSAAEAGWGQDTYPRQGGEAAPGEWASWLKERRNPKWDSFSWLTVRALFESVNDLLAKFRPEIVDERRARWVAGQRGRTPNASLVFSPPRPGAGTGVERAFFLVGDTGEQDASQYALAPYLTVPATQTDPGGSVREPEFMTIVSDVIYPAGDINEYVNGFYIPYRHFQKPIYAVPGNHDWYDGLDGFMYHFCGAEPLAPERFRRTEVRPSTRLAGSLWRGGEVPERQRLSGWRASRPWGRDATMAVQPAPYFAIDLDDLLLVAIDTGVTGTVDEEQGLWLVGVSGMRKQKVLLTGKPIYVDGAYHPGEIAWTREADPEDPDDPRHFATVDDIVREERFGYLAAIGGDVHNYQRYPVRLKQQNRTIHYLVSGGGGAYLSPTQRIPPLGAEPTTVTRGGQEVELPADADRYDRPDLPDPGPTFRCYPQRGDSLAYSARRAGPRVFNAVQIAAASFVAAASLLLYAIPLPSTSRSALTAVFSGLLAAALLCYLTVPKLTGPKRKRLSGATVATVAALALLAGAAWVADLCSGSDLLSSPRFWGSAGVILLVPFLIVAAILLAHDLRGSIPAALPQLAAVGAFAAAALLLQPLPGVGPAPAWFVSTLCVAVFIALAMLLLGAIREGLPDEEEDTEPLSWPAFACGLLDGLVVATAPAALAVALTLKADGEWVPWLAVAMVGVGALASLLALAFGTFAPVRLSGKRLAASKLAAVAAYLSLTGWVTIATLLLHLIGDGWVVAAAVSAVAALAMLLVFVVLILLIAGTVLRKRVVACLLLVLLLIASRYLAHLPFAAVAAALLVGSLLGVLGIRKGRLNADSAQTEIRTRLRGGTPPDPATARTESLAGKEETLFGLFYPYSWDGGAGESGGGAAGLKGTATRLIAELSDSDEPPFFKHFLRVDIRGREAEEGERPSHGDRELTIRCFGVTGFADAEDDPPVEDEISIPFHSSGSFSP